MSEQLTDEQLIEDGKRFEHARNTPGGKADLTARLAARLEAVIAERDAERARAKEAEGELCDIDSEVPRLYECYDGTDEVDEDRPVPLYDRVVALRERAEAAETEVRRYREMLALPDALLLQHFDGGATAEVAPTKVGELVDRAEAAEAELLRIYSTDKGGWSTVQRWLDPEGEFDELEDLCRGLDERLERSESEAAKLRERVAELESEEEFCCPECGSFDCTEAHHEDDLSSMRCRACDYCGTPGEDFPSRVEVVDKLERRVAELEAKRAWQPIETAPKDGTNFLGFTPRVQEVRENPIIDRWHWEPQRFHRTPKPYWSRWASAPTVDRKSQPTHWMPLPAPPQAETSEAAPAGAEGGEVEA